MPASVALLASLLALSVEGDPSLSRTSIVAVRANANSSQLWLVQPSGGEPRRIGGTSSVMSRPSWSLDGKSVLYTERANARADLYLLPVKGGRKTLLSRQPGLNADARPAPDGTAIALTLTRDGNTEIYTMSRGKLTRLTETWQIDTSPTWSPAGDRLAFVSARLGAAEIFVMDRDGANAEPLTGLGLNAQNPEWSPAGDQIVFSARDGEKKADIWSVDVNTRALVRLTSGAGLDVEPSFSPDGRWIVFVSDRSGARDLWVMSAEGGQPRRITNGGDYAMPAWSPEGRDALAHVE
jgi:TolB protein